MIKIAPSILAADNLNLQSEVIKVDEAGAESIHIDVMDGHYVNNISFGPAIVKNLREITKKTLDVHLMISPVKEHIDSFLDAGSDIISFHPEADKNSELIYKKIKNSGCKCGIAIHPNINIDEIKKFLIYADIVIVMTVIPGFGGQKFMEDQLIKITELSNIKKRNKYNFEIEVDGGINKQTGKLCINEGANILVAGSYIFNESKKNYKKLIDSLK